MDCRLFEHQVQLSIDGLLSAEEREEMLLHAQTCPSCAALLQDMTALAGLLTKRLKAVEPPAGFSRAVMAALPGSSIKPASRPKVRRRPIWWRFGTVAAAAALLLAVGLHNIGLSQPGVEPTNPRQDPSRIVAVDNPNPNFNPVDSSNTGVNPIDPLPNPSNNDPTQIPSNTGDVADEPTGDSTVKEPPVDQPINNGEPAVGIDDDNPPFVAAMDLPRPANRLLPSTEGVFALAVLAVYEDCDAILPSFNEAGEVEFYTKYKNKIHKWTQSLGAEEDAKCLEEVKTLPTLPEIMGNVEGSAAANFSRVTAVAPDGRYIAVNQAGEQPGIWLHKKRAATVDDSAEQLGQAEQEQLEPGQQISTAGGGKILCWSPDSNKLIYTDDAGKLFVYHFFEKKTQPLYNGAVTCASWAKDSKTVVFSGKMDNKDNSAIYTIIVP